MKQYTTIAQTTKLIELGFKKPKGWYVDGVTNNMKLYVNIDENPMMFNYSIGELIEMLPKEMECELGDLGLSIENNIYEQPNEWIVAYDGRHQTNSIELVDALYYMIFET